MKADVADAAVTSVPAPDRSPEKLRRRLRGDLDTIVLHAMSKEPARRYGSVERFAEDIRRHLEGLPVTARRDSWSYRAGKFITRHKLGVAATALLVAAILGGVIATVREARIAAANQNRAERRFNDVRKLANSLMFEIHDAIRDLPGSTAARRLLVTRALEYLDSLNEQSRGDASLQKELASAYERVGDVLGYPYAANLGDKPGALQSYRKALAMRESLALADPNDKHLQQDIAGNYFRLAQVLETSGDFSGALTALRKILPITEKLATSNDPVIADHLSGTYYFTGVIQVETGNPAEALKNYQRAAALRDVALQANPGNFPLRTHLAADYAGMAKCMELTHDLPHAIEKQSEAVAILEEVSKSHPENATVSEYLGEGVNRLATYEYEVADYRSAVETYRRAHQIFGGLLTADPKNPLAKTNFGFSDIGIARSMVHLGKANDALKILQESINTFDDLSPQGSGNRYVRSGLGNAYSALGEAYSALAIAPRASAQQKRAQWTKARSACETSQSFWNDKEKRGELESGERGESVGAARCVANSEAGLQVLAAGVDRK